VQALHRIYRRRHAISRGIPINAISLGSTSQFIYEDGVLCFLRDDNIEILDIVGSKNQMTLSFSDILGNYQKSDENDISLAHYSQSILSIIFRDLSTTNDYLFIFHIDFNKRKTTRLANLPIEESTRKIFVRNTRDFLYYGMHSRARNDECHEWVLQGIALNKDKPFPAEARSKRDGATHYESELIELKGFTSAEIGSTVAFQIHDGYFWAVTNGDDIDVIEVDWTSSYRCAKFPIDDPRKENIRPNPHLFRRQHKWGPINDSWTNLTLQVDERTNKLMAVEALMEWLEGQNLQRRSFYISEVLFSENDERPEAPPLGDLYAPLATSRSRYQESPVRQMWQVHQEEANLYQMSKSGDDSKVKSFIPAHTKFKTYNLAANTFIDLVDDAKCCPWELRPDKRKSCLRLRSGSRKLRKFQPASKDTLRARKRMREEREECDDSDYHISNKYPVVMESDKFDPKENSPYSYSPINFWPLPAPTSDKATIAHNTMNPDFENNRSECLHGVHVDGVADERTIVYLVRDALDMRTSPIPINGKLVVLSFDRDTGICKRLAKNGCIPRSRESTPSSSIWSPTLSSARKSRKRWREDDEFQNFERMPPMPEPGLAILNSLLSDEIENMDLNLSDEEWGFDS
jgi:hypothetical protein